MEPALEMLSRHSDTGWVEEERGQKGRFGHLPAFTMLGPWVGVSPLDMKRRAKNKFKDIQTSTSPWRPLLG